MKYIVLLCLLLMLSGCVISPNSVEYDSSYRKENVKYPVEGLFIIFSYKGCNSELDIVGTSRVKLEEKLGILLTNKNIRYNFLPANIDRLSREFDNKAKAMKMQGYIYIYIFCSFPGVFKYIVPNFAINYVPYSIPIVRLFYYYIPSGEGLNFSLINYKRTDAYLTKARTLHNPIIYFTNEPVGEFPMDEVLKWIDKVTNP